MAMRGIANARGLLSANCTVRHNLCPYALIEGELLKDREL